MSAVELEQHLATGTTTVCRAWTITRRDGRKLGFTDHDRDLMLDGILHRASSGMTARTLQSSTGLSVDNSEAVGALSDASVTEEDLTAGRFDAADVQAWLVNWANPEARLQVFRGSIGEVTRTGAEFRAELRGLAEALNQPIGRAYTRGCAAVLGDTRCRFDLTQPGYTVERTVEKLDSNRSILTFSTFSTHDERWFEGGRLDVLSGPAAGLSAMVMSDRFTSDGRVVSLWQGIRDDLAAGDLVRLTAGCDKRAETCRLKFGNFLNFRGFPHMPGEDFLTAYPRSGQGTEGGSLTREGGA